MTIQPTPENPTKLIPHISHSKNESRCISYFSIRLSWFDSFISNVIMKCPFKCNVYNFQVQNEDLFLPVKPNNITPIRSPALEKKKHWCFCICVCSDSCSCSWVEMYISFLKKKAFQSRNKRPKRSRNVGWVQRVRQSAIAAGLRSLRWCKHVVGM